MKYSRLVYGLVFTASVAAGTQAAAGIDGTRNVLCASQEVVACVEGPSCMQGSARNFDVPGFLYIDVKKKVVRAHKEGDAEASSPVRNVDKTDTQYILQGVEAHRGWSIAIDRVDGDMTLTSAGADVNIMVFGSCTAI